MWKEGTKKPTSQSMKLPYHHRLLLSARYLTTRVSRRKEAFRLRRPSLSAVFADLASYLSLLWLDFCLQQSLQPVSLAVFLLDSNKRLRRQSRYLPRTRVSIASLSTMCSSDTPCGSSADACDSPTESFSGQNSSSTPTAPPEPTGSSAFITPTSDCRSLSSNPNYLVFQNNATSITRDVSFNIQCDSDYKWPLVLAMRVYRFEDCIQACAVHATNSPDSYTACVVAVYKPDSGQSLTCWLKSRGPQAVMVNVGVDSARILGSL